MDIAKMLSGKVNSMQQSGSMNASAKAAKMKREGKEVFDLGAGAPDFNVPEHVAKAAIDAINEGFNTYTTADGIPELREAIAEKLKKDNGLDFEWENEIIVVPGLKQAFFYSMYSILNPGDEVILFEPFWVSYPEIVKMCGGKPVSVETPLEKRFKASAEDIEAKITEKTKAIVLNNPCNPTGALWSKDELKQVLDVAVKHDLLVIADEVYEKIVFDDKEFHAFASLPGAFERTVTLNGFSKAYAMHGWRLGYIAADSQIVKSAVKVQQQTATCPNSVAQKAAIAALRGSQEQVSEMLKEFQARRELFMRKARETGKLECMPPEGTFYAFPSIEKLSMKSAEAADLLLSKAGVACVPGSAFGNAGEGFLRFSLTTSRENLEKVFENMSKVI